MYTRRPALKTFRSIRALAELRVTIAPHYSCSVSVSNFVRNLSTATERSNFDSDLDGYGAENHANYGNFNGGDRFYSSNLGGFERKHFVDPRLRSGVNSTLGSVHVVGHLDEFIKDGKLKEAVQLLGQLLNEGVDVEPPRYMALMTACGEKQSLDMARSVHEHLLQSMPNLEIRTYNWILEMYVKCGSMVDAFSVFDEMPQRNLTSWDIMISGLAKNGLGEDSIDLFGEFKRSGLRPDGQMFAGVFSACGVLCDIVEGMLHFESMTKDYGIHPTMEHYVGIVGMFGCAGCLDEALEFIEDMPVEPAVDIWETLMKYSRIHGDVVLGDRCAEFVELLDPSRLNEQSRKGLIPVNPADLAREKEEMKKKKLTGQNLSDFRDGERSHPEHEKIYALLGGLREQLNEAGYIPEHKCVLHDIDPDSKEKDLMAHSGRLAAAHGFMTTPPRSSLRIIINFRICIDCHNVFKIISKIVGREIILRCDLRFHHFRDGSCSCNDIW